MRRLSSDKSKGALMSIAYQGARGMKGVKETTVTYGEKEVKVAIVSGLKNASDLPERPIHCSSQANRRRDRE